MYVCMCARTLACFLCGGCSLAAHVLQLWRSTEGAAVLLDFEMVGHLAHGARGAPQCHAAVVAAVGLDTSGLGDLATQQACREPAKPHKGREDPQRAATAAATSTAAVVAHTRRDLAVGHTRAAQRHPQIAAIVRAATDPRGPSHRGLAGRRWRGSDIDDLGGCNWGDHGAWSWACHRD